MIAAARDEVRMTLSRRLNELRSMAVARQGENSEYGLTPAGKKLCQIILPLYSWAEGWAASAPSRAGHGA